MDTESNIFQSLSFPGPSSRGNLKGGRKWGVLLLFLLPLALIAFKQAGLSGSDNLQDAISLTGMPEDVQDRIGYVLFVPLAAVIVVFFRVTLGIRLLGPFRSILLALAFHMTGIGMGLFFLLLVVGMIVLIRPVLREIQLPYFGRVSVVLSAVAIIIMCVMVAGRWFQLDTLQQVAYFPIVVLCLTGDGFARTFYKEGMRSALWRGAATAAVAVLITLLWSIPGFVNLLIRFPELLILEVGLIIVIAEFFGFRLFQNVNPLPIGLKRKVAEDNIKVQPNRSKIIIKKADLENLDN